MFGIIDNNSKYDVSEDKIDTSYWQERMTYNLDVTSKLRGEDIFVYRYSEVYDGYFVSLTMDAKKLFAEIPRAKINITLELDSPYLTGKEINIVGLDYNAFENLELDTLTVKGSTQTFYLLEKSLFGTNLQTLKQSKGITFDGIQNAIDNEYTGVIV